MSEIFVYDRYTSGHHLSYLKIYVSAFLELGINVKIFTSDIEGVENYLPITAEPFRGKVNIVKIEVRKKASIENKVSNRVGFVKDLVNSYSAFMNFVEVKKNINRYIKNNNSIVFLMWFEPFVSRYLSSFILNFFLPFHVAALWFHPSHIKKSNNNCSRYRGLLHPVPILKSKKLVFLGLFDNHIVSLLNEKYKRKVFKVLPDVAEKHQPDLGSGVVCEIIRRANGRRIVSLLGSLDRRKNLITFFHAVEKCTSDEIFYLCAGKFHKENFSDEQRKYIIYVAKSFKEKLYFHDQHIVSDTEFDSLFYISDVIVAVYNNFTSSSNLIMKAALFERYIIVANEFLMCEIVEKYGIGVCVESGNRKSLHKAILHTVLNKKEMDGRFSDYVKDHSFSRLKECLKPLAEFSKG